MKKTFALLLALLLVLGLTACGGGSDPVSAVFYMGRADRLCLQLREETHGVKCSQEGGQRAARPTANINIMQKRLV